MKASPEAHFQPKLEILILWVIQDFGLGGDTNRSLTIHGPYISWAQAPSTRRIKVREEEITLFFFLLYYFSPNLICKGRGYMCALFLGWRPK